MFQTLFNQQFAILNAKYGAQVAQGLMHAHEIVMRKMQGVCPTK
jgi:hypothetical protein